MPCEKQTVIRLPADAKTNALIGSILSQNGFKWSFRRGTDLCKDDIDVRVKGNAVEVLYRSRRRSVFSRSVGHATRVSIPADLTACIPFVYVSRPVRHFDWDGVEQEP